ncbi:unnamed protein product [Rhizopus stolonifer]
MGLRASHLIDITSLDLDQAKDLLSKLRKNSTQGQSLILLQFKDCFSFLCNKTLLRQHILSTLSANSLVFIAVQGREPVKTEMPAQLIYWLQEKLLPFLSTAEAVFYSAVIPKCMVAITGWALEYPIIYTTHEISDGPEDELDEWEVRTNCLGNRCLEVIQCWIADHMLLSFSYPLCLIDSGEKITRDLELKMNKRLVKEKCQIKKVQVMLDRFAI